MRILEAVWVMFTNNGMYSTAETIVILVISTIVSIVVMHEIGRRAEEETRAAMIADLGYEGYLRIIRQTRR